MSKVCHTAYLEIRRIGSIRKYLTTEVTITMHLFVCRTSKREHIRPLLVDLYWLPVSHRIEYKIATVCYNVISGSAPQCLADPLQLYTPSRSVRSSADPRFFRISTRRKKFQGQRLFLILALSSGIVSHFLFAVLRLCRVSNHN